MLFTTDQQTIEDLNIFGKHSRASIYTLYNRTLTRGGAELLEDMFRFPLSNAAAINKRSGIIRYFSANPVFPFDTELFDIAEQYLAKTDEVPNWLAAVRAAEAKKASEIRVLDMRGITSFADYFDICTDANHHQMQAIREEVGLQLQPRGDTQLSGNG